MNRFDSAKAVMVPHMPRDDPTRFGDGDLVKTMDGRYAVILDTNTRKVSFGDGAEVCLEDGQWVRLRRLPVNVRDGQAGPRANFAHIFKTRI